MIHLKENDISQPFPTLHPKFIAQFTWGGLINSLHESLNPPPLPLPGKKEQTVHERRIAHSDA